MNMNAINSMIVMSLAALPAVSHAKDGRVEYPPEAHAPAIPAIEELPPCQGPFDSSVESLKKYKCPAWFRDAKFGIWAHWGPQAVAQDGDWYARRLYSEDRHFYRNHLAELGLTRIMAS